MTTVFLKKWKQKTNNMCFLIIKVFCFLLLLFGYIAYQNKICYGLLICFVVIGGICALYELCGMIMYNKSKKDMI